MEAEKSKKLIDSPIYVAKILGIAWNRAELFAVAAENLRVEGILASATVAECLHHRVDFLLENF